MCEYGIQNKISSINIHTTTTILSSFFSQRVLEMARTKHSKPVPNGNDLNERRERMKLPQVSARKSEPRLEGLCLCMLPDGRSGDGKCYECQKIQRIRRYFDIDKETLEKPDTRNDATSGGTKKDVNVIDLTKDADIKEKRLSLKRKWKRYSEEEALASGKKLIRLPKTKGEQK